MAVIHHHTGLDPARQIRFREAITFWCLGLLGALSGTRCAVILQGDWLQLGFAMLMLAAALTMLLRARGSHLRKTVHARWLLPVVALVVGFLSGLFGVGGGFLVVPALVLVFHLSVAEAASTSLAVIAMTSATALMFRADTWATVPWLVVLVVLFGGVVGAVVGSSLQGAVAQAVLERIFACLLIVVAVGMALEGAFGGSKASYDDANRSTSMPIATSQVTTGKRWVRGMPRLCQLPRIAPPPNTPTGATCPTP